MHQNVLLVVMLVLVAGCQTGKVVGHTNGMEVVKGVLCIQYDSKKNFNNVFINGILCEKAKNRFLANVPVLFENTPIVVTTVTPQGETVVLEAFTLKAESNGLPTKSPDSCKTVFIDDPPDGMVIHSR